MTDGGGESENKLSRRQFLVYTGAGSTLYVLRDALTVEALAQAGQGQGLPLAAATLTRMVRRRLDFLSLRFEFHNLKFDNSTPKRLVKVSQNQPAFLVAVLPPQHLADEALTETAIESPPGVPPGDVRSRLAGPSRLAFLVPPSALPMNFNFDTMLNWARLAQRVVPAAADGSGPATLVLPSPDQTAIELPWFLILSPRPEAGWAHKRQPVTFGGRTELWHTRLATRNTNIQPPVVDESDDANRTVRAVWARDPGFPGVPNEPAGPLLSLSANDRYQIAHLSAGLAGRRAVKVNHLMLSALGGWLDSQGDWDPPAGFSVEQWRHRATMGRDSYVRVVRRGFLMPFGHKAAKITISERQFRTAPGGHPEGAYLVRREFILVRQPVKDYGEANAKHQPSDGRGFPFRSVRLTTLSTPNLEPDTGLIYFPLLEGTDEDVLFDLVGVDWEGQASEFNSPLMWLDASKAYEGPNQLGGLMSLYNFNPKPQRRDRKANGQKVAFAPAKEAGDTSFPVESLIFRATELVGDTANQLQQRLNDLKALGEPPFFPLLEEAQVRLSAAADTATAVADLVGVQLDQAFIDFGLPGMDLPDIPNPSDLDNAGQLFLGMVGDAVGLDFGSTDKAGGIAMPNFGIAALSRLVGPVGGVLDDLRNGVFDPKTFFDAGAKLLGSLPLGDVIKKVTDAASLGDKGPKIQTILVPKPPGVPEKVITRLDWAPDLENFGDPLKILETGGDSSLTLKAETITDLQDPANSTFNVEGNLRNVKLHLIGADTAFLIIEVKSVKFTAAKDKPPDVDPQLGEIHFAGALAFVEEMRNFLSSLGKGFAIDVQPTGIEASLTLPLPAISVGVFSLQNISIGLGAIIPFTGDPARFRFSFCSRENPFILTVAMFGGGGFCAIECGTDKSIMLEISLEFGAALAFDIGVASGGVEIMAGIYIKVENDDALLSGFLRIAGELDILGLIRISCEIYLGFEYHVASDKCVGRAKFYLEIEIFGFITIPVKAEVERKFGGESDPTFAQLMDEPDWTEYCNAYAPLGTP